MSEGPFDDIASAVVDRVKGRRSPAGRSTALAVADLVGRFGNASAGVGITPMAGMLSHLVAAGSDLSDAGALEHAAVHLGLPLRQVDVSNRAQNSVRSSFPFRRSRSVIA